MSFPTLPLEPINRSSACLLGRRKPKLIGNDILQIASAVASLSEVRIEQERQATERKRLKVEAALVHQQTVQKAQEVSLRARAERIQAANEAQIRFCDSFKRVCKEQLGAERYMELVNEANQRLGIS